MTQNNFSNSETSVGTPSLIEKSERGSTQSLEVTTRKSLCSSFCGMGGWSFLIGRASSFVPTSTNVFA